MIWRLPWWLYVGEHILTKMKKSGVLAPVHIAGGEKQDRMTAEIVAPCEYKRSDFKANSVANRKPMQIRENRCDVAEPRFLCDYPSKSVLGHAAGEPDLKRMCRKEGRTEGPSSELGVWRHIRGYQFQPNTVWRHDPNLMLETCSRVIFILNNIFVSDFHRQWCAPCVNNRWLIDFS